VVASFLRIVGVAGGLSAVTFAGILGAVRIARYLKREGCYSVKGCSICEDF
jgi:hypothetical protein